MVTEQMAAILRCKQPATEERQIRGSGRTKKRESGVQYKEDYKISGTLFVCDRDFTTAITFSLILQRNKQKACQSRSGAN